MDPPHRVHAPAARLGPQLFARPYAQRRSFISPDPGGTVQRVDTPDSNAPAASAPIAFYGTANYNANPSAYNPVQICTPLTSDAAGDIYFGFSVNDPPPAD